MKRRTPRNLAAIAAVFLSAALACGQEKKPEPMRGIDRGQPQPERPTLLIGVNDAVGALAEPGWPLIVSATRVPDGKTPPTPLPANLRLKVTDERGAEVTVPLTAVPNDAGPTAKSISWLAGETATAQLAAGLYRVSAVAGQDGLAGWRIESGEFRVVPQNPERIGLPGHLRIRRSILLGKKDEALAEANRLTAAHAGDKAAWIAKGDLLMLQDKPDEALIAYDRALDLHKPADREPLTLLARRRNASLRSLENRGIIVPSTPPP